METGMARLLRQFTIAAVRRRGEEVDKLEKGATGPSSPLTQLDRYIDRGAAIQSTGGAAPSSDDWLSQPPPGWKSKET
jgi:hypothetical protein